MAEAEKVTRGRPPGHTEMPATISRNERLDAIRSLLPPRRKDSEGRLRPFGSRQNNAIFDLLEIAARDGALIHSLRARLSQIVHGTLSFFRDSDTRELEIPAEVKLTLDVRAHSLLTAAWGVAVKSGEITLADEIDKYLSAAPEVVHGQPSE